MVIIKFYWVRDALSHGHGTGGLGRLGHSRSLFFESSRCLRGHLQLADGVVVSTEMSLWVSLGALKELNISLGALKLVCSLAQLCVKVVVTGHDGTDGMVGLV